MPGLGSHVSVSSTMFVPFLLWLISPLTLYPCFTPSLMIRFQRIKKSRVLNKQRWDSDLLVRQNFNKELTSCARSMKIWLHQRASQMWRFTPLLHSFTASGSFLSFLSLKGTEIIQSFVTEMLFRPWESRVEFLRCPRWYIQVRCSVLACPSQARPGQKGTFDLMSMGGLNQPDVSPCTLLPKNAIKVCVTTLAQPLNSFLG